ncbi:MAG: DUF6644 family protein [Acidimicrobiia bacterium]
MTPHAGPAWAMWLEGSGLAAAMRHWLWLYPIVEIAHILGFVFVIGAAVMFDLRLLGFSRRLPVDAMAHHLLPWSWAGLALVVPSGLMMFAAHAAEWVGNPAFWVKLGLLAAAGLNALVFDRGVFRSVAKWNQGVTAPAAAQLAAVASLLFWGGVVSAGRLLAYL